MKLSDAIKLGAMLRPQITGHLISLNGSCALGAAGEAAGFLTDCESGLALELDNFAELRKHFPILTVAVVDPTNIAGDDSAYELQDIIVLLNDHDHWTRERIATFVQGIEERLEQAAATNQNEVVNASCGAPAEVEVSA